MRSIVWIRLEGVSFKKVSGFNHWMQGRGKIRDWATWRSADIFCCHHSLSWRINLNFESLSVQFNICFFLKENYVYITIVYTLIDLLLSCVFFVVSCCFYCYCRWRRRWLKCNNFSFAKFWQLNLNTLTPPFKKSHV